MKLSDLFKPRWMHFDSKVRLEALKKITEQYQLQKIALLTPYQDLWAEALERLSAPEKLLYEKLNCLNASPSPVTYDKIEMQRRMQAVLDRIQKPEILRDIVLYFFFGEKLRLGALRKISKNNLLREIAVEADWEKIRLEAVRCITAESELKKVLLQSECPKTRSAAAQRIKDQVALIEITNNPHTKFDVRMTIAEELEKRKDKMINETRKKINELVNSLNPDWQTIRQLILQCAWDDQIKWAGKLPKELLDLELLQTITNSGIKNSSEVYSDIKTILVKLEAAGWRVSEVREELRCGKCNGSGEIWVNLGSAFEKDVDGPYECGDCNGKGKSVKIRIKCIKDQEKIEFCLI
jgi:hypothetical protein